MPLKSAFCNTASLETDLLIYFVPVTPEICKSTLLNRDNTDDSSMIEKS